MNKNNNIFKHYAPVEFERVPSALEIQKNLDEVFPYDSFIEPRISFNELFLKLCDWIQRRKVVKMQVSTDQDLFVYHPHTNMDDVQHWLITKASIYINDKQFDASPLKYFKSTPDFYFRISLASVIGVHNYRAVFDDCFLYELIMMLNDEIPIKGVGDIDELAMTQLIYAARRCRRSTGVQAQGSCGEATATDYFLSALDFIVDHTSPRLINFGIALMDSTAIISYCAHDVHVNAKYYAALGVKECVKRAIRNIDVEAIIKHQFINIGAFMVEMKYATHTTASFVARIVSLINSITGNKLFGLMETLSGVLRDYFGFSNISAQDNSLSPGKRLIDLLKSLRDGGTAVLNCPMYDKFYNVMAYFCTTALSVELGLRSYGEIVIPDYKRVSKKAFRGKIDFLGQLFDAIVDFLDSGYQYFIEGNKNAYIHNGDKYGEWLQTVCELDGKSNMIIANGLKRVGYLTAMEYDIKLRYCIQYGKEQLAMCKYIGSKKCLNLINANLLKCMKLEAMRINHRSSNSHKPLPFALLLYGNSSVGKSYMVTKIHRLYWNIFHKGLPFNEEAVFHFNPTTEHVDGYQNHHDIVVMDDLCKDQPDKVNGIPNDVKSIIDIINCVPCLVKKADLDSKGNVYWNAGCVIGTTNVKTLYAHLYASDALALLGRFQIHMTVVPKVEFQKKDENGVPLGTVDYDIMPDHMVEDAHNVILERVIPKKQVVVREHTGHRITRRTDIPVAYEKLKYTDPRTGGTKTLLSIMEAQAVISQMMKAHLDRTINYKTKLDPSIVDGLCCKECGVYMCYEHKPDNKEVNENIVEKGETTLMLKEDEYYNVGPQSQGLVEFSGYTLMGAFTAFCVMFMYHFSIRFGDYTQKRVKDLKLLRSDLREIVVLGNKADTYYFKNRYKVIDSFPKVKTAVASLVAMYTMKFFFNKLSPSPKNDKALINVKQDTWYIDCNITENDETPTESNALDVSTIVEAQGGSGSKYACNDDAKERQNVWTNLSKGAIHTDKQPLKTVKIDDMIRLTRNNMVKFDVFIVEDGKKIALKGVGLFVKGNNMLVPTHSLPPINETFQIKYGDLASNNKFSRSQVQSIDETTRYDIPGFDITVIRCLGGAPYRNIMNFFSDFAELKEGEQYESILVGYTQKHIFNSTVTYGLAYDVKKKEKGEERRVIKREYFNKKYFSYNLSLPGECVSPLIVKFGSFSGISGLHIAGSPVDGGYSICITDRLIQQAIDSISNSIIVTANSDGLGRLDDKNFKKDSNLTITEAIHRKSPLNYLEAQHEEGLPTDDYKLMFLGELTQFRRGKPKIDVRAGYLQEEIAEVYGPLPMGVPEWKIGYVNGEWNDPFADDLKIISGHNNSIPPALLQKVALGYFNDIKNNLKIRTGFKIATLTDYEAINGIPGVNYIDAVKKLTSGGFNYPSKKKNLLVHDPREGYPDGVNYSSEIYESIEELEDHLQYNAVIPIIMQHLKSEPRKIKKRERPVRDVTRTGIPLCYQKKYPPTHYYVKKPRVFGGTPLILAHIMRKHLLPFCKIIQDNNFVFECAVGINATSREWNQFYKHITKFGTHRVFGGDYFHYDKSIMSELSLTLTMVWWWILSLLLFTTMTQQFFFNMMIGTVFPVYLALFMLFMVFASFPSGVVITSIFNSGNNSLYIRLAWVICGYPIEEFKDNVVVMTYGDDNIIGVSEKYDFNFIKMKKALATIGVRYTLPDKSDNEIKFMNIYEIEFLKRKFRFSPELNTIVAPLDFNSILKSLSFISETDLGPIQQCREALESAEREMVLHGREKYDDFVDKMQVILTKKDVHHMFHTYDWWINHLRVDYL